MWSFFDQIGDDIEVKYKLSEYMAWQKYSWEREPSAVGVLFNPDHNLSLAHYNIVEHFLSDVQADPNGFENLSSYKLLRSFLSENLVQRFPGTLQVQFKITGINGSEKIEVFTSPWIKVGPS